MSGATSWEETVSRQTFSSFGSLLPFSLGPFFSSSALPNGTSGTTRDSPSSFFFLSFNLIRRKVSVTLFRRSRNYWFTNEDKRTTPKIAIWNAYSSCLQLFNELCCRPSITDRAVFERTASFFQTMTKDSRDVVFKFTSVQLKLNYQSSVFVWKYLSWGLKYFQFKEHKDFQCNYC